MAYEAEFEHWWAGCWLKVGKIAAKREYEKARKTHGATAQELIAGRDAYKTHKPGWQEWVYPKTWLHQGRWMDQWETPKKPQREDWFEECKRVHGGECGLDRYRHMMRMPPKVKA